MPRAMIPGIALESPETIHWLATAWPDAGVDAPYRHRPQR